MSDFADLQIVIPVYNDWESIGLLLPDISRQLSSASLRADVLLIDDGSSEEPPTEWTLELPAINAVRILRLQRNLGHQRAICVALCHLREETSCQQVLVMDGDGEDAPSDIPRLVAELNAHPESRIVFAERAKRSEGLLFRFFYQIYRTMHVLLVGHRVRVGNFSVMRRSCLESLSASAELWNHYAAAAFATRQPMRMLPTNRAHRLAGESRMNFPSLVMHGLSALSVFADRISTRLLIATAIGLVMTMGGMVAVAAIRLTTGLAIPGWATNAFGLLALLLMQIATFMFTFCFIVLLTRGLSPFIPLRDYRYFLNRVDRVQ